MDREISNQGSASKSAINNYFWHLEDLGIWKSEFINSRSFTVNLQFIRYIICVKIRPDQTYLGFTSSGHSNEIVSYFLSNFIIYNIFLLILLKVETNALLLTTLNNVYMATDMKERNQLKIATH